MHQSQSEPAMNGLAQFDRYRLALLAAATLLCCAGCGGNAQPPGPNAGTATATADKSGPKLRTLDELYYGTSQPKFRKTSYIDSQQQEVLHGDYLEWYSSGEKRAAGRYEHGLRSGVWNAWHKNGAIWVSGRFRAPGQPDGEWLYYDERSQLMGRRIAGVKVGPWREPNCQGDCVGAGDYRNGKLDGVWRFVDQKQQEICTLEFRSGVVDGAVTLRSGSLGQLVLRVENAQERTAQRQLTLDGRSYSGGDPLFGKMIVESPTPPLADFFWTPLDAPFDPPTVHTFRESWPSGAPRVESGFCLRIENGQPVQLPHGRTARWHENRQLAVEQFYDLGVEHGKFSAWYENGKPRYAIEFARGNPVKNWKFWHPSGARQAEGILRQDGTAGDWSFWDPAGVKTKVAAVESWLQEQIDPR